MASEDTPTTFVYLGRWFDPEGLIDEHRRAGGRWDSHTFIANGGGLEGAVWVRSEVAAQLSELGVVQYVLQAASDAVYDRIGQAYEITYVSPVAAKASPFGGTY